MERTRSKSLVALDKVDRLLSEAQPANEQFNDPGEVTTRTQVEEIARATAEKLIAKQPSQPEIHVHVDSKPDSDPPASTGFALSWKRGLRMPSGKLPPWAVVIIALGVAVIAAVAYVATH